MEQLFISRQHRLKPVRWLNRLLKKGTDSLIPPGESMEIQAVALAEKVSVPFLQQPVKPTLLLRLRVRRHASLAQRFQLAALFDGQQFTTAAGRDAPVDLVPALAE